ncbi:MAG: flagellar biosynthetic protein FliP [Candidatus Dadabacteria bacterium]|nr:MAG: flagellar biosynthetic protein FliP [Candidatus Dadabacteria bacterium]
MDALAAGSAQPISEAMRTFLLITAIALVPMALLISSCFLRLIVILSLLRTALGSPSLPPTMVLTGLALVLTWMAMAPTWTQVQEQAIDPLLAGEIGFSEAVEAATGPMRTYMLHYAKKRDLRRMLELQGASTDQPVEQLSLSTLIPAYVLSELSSAFTIGVLIFIPFILVDLIIASLLLSLGMMMVPPTVISLPVKLALFVMVDGWSLLIGRVMAPLVGGS